MTKNTKVVSLAGIAAVVLVIVILVVRDCRLRPQGTFDCGDGPRRTIDIRDFTTRYSAYSVELEANVSEKAKVETKISPVELQQLSDSLESANEFRKALVAGYNACAVTKAQYESGLRRFQAMDVVAREINQLIAKAFLSQAENAQLSRLIEQFDTLAAAEASKPQEKP